MDRVEAKHKTHQGKKKEKKGKEKKKQEEENDMTMTPCIIIIIIISRAELIGTAGVNFFPFSFVKKASSTIFPFFIASSQQQW
jgi:hypothetical protein